MQFPSSVESKPTWLSKLVTFTVQSSEALGRGIRTQTGALPSERPQVKGQDRVWTQSSEARQKVLSDLKGSRRVTWSRGSQMEVAVS